MNLYETRKTCFNKESIQSWLPPPPQHICLPVHSVSLFDIVTFNPLLTANCHDDVHMCNYCTVLTAVHGLHNPYATGHTLLCG